MHSDCVLAALLVMVTCVLPPEVRGQCTTDPSLQYEIVETMLNAQFIVFGQYNGEDPTSNYGKFTIYCIFKGTGAGMPENVTIDFRGNECSPTMMTNNTNYILMLRSRNIHEEDIFLLYEPSKDSSAAFPATEQNLNLAVNLCRLRDSDISEPQDQTQTTVSCPTRTATEENCVTEDITSVAATRGKQGSPIIGLFVILVGVLLLGGN